MTSPFATTLPADMSRPFSARFAGTCAVSGLPFSVGCDVHNIGNGLVMASTIRAWEFTRVDGVDGSRYARPVESVVMGAVTEGRMVATLNNLGVRAYWLLKGDKVEEVTSTGGNTMRLNRKAPAAFWSTVASKAQAVRCFDAR